MPNSAWISASDVGYMVQAAHSDAYCSTFIAARRGGGGGMGPGALAARLVAENPGMAAPAAVGVVGVLGGGRMAVVLSGPEPAAGALNGNPGRRDSGTSGSSRRPDCDPLRAG